MWDEIKKMRVRHEVRLSSIDKGKSTMDAELERIFLEETLGRPLDKTEDVLKKDLITLGKSVGVVWDWLTAFRGLGSGHIVAQLLAQIDDIGKFDTISKLWRFCGLAVIDGKAEAKSSEHYNRRLKALLLGPQGVVDQFVMKRTFPYRDMYDERKVYEREKHPEPIKTNGKWKYNDGHIDMRARRYVAKRFLSHLWVKWREFDGLSVSQPYVQAILGHTQIDSPPDFQSIEE